MASLPTFLGVNVVTPRGVVTHQDTDALTAPGELGEFELFPGHVPMLTALRPGVLTLGDRTRTRYAVSAGYLRVDQANAVEVLVEQAVLGKDVDVGAAKADLAAADAELAKWGDRPTDGDWQNLLHRQAWAQARLDAAAS
ncbi:MAG: ATP synthase F1 subunit epsilon [Kofleriaceae bacterium]